jgi:hypothetical protein
MEKSIRRLLVNGKLTNWQTATPDEINRLIHQVVFEETDETAVPDYTGDIREAWKVAEQERLLVRPDLFKGWWAGKFQRVYVDGIQLGYEHATRDDDPAMAICRAALKFHDDMIKDGWRKYPSGWIK